MSEIQSYHYQHLARGITTQTSKAIVAFLIVTSTYVFTYLDYIPVSIMLGWILSVFIFLTLRFWNSRSLEQATTLEIYKKHVFYLLLICIYSAIVWVASSVLGLLYAPPYYQFFSLIMVILIAFAGVFSLGNFRHIYVIFASIVMVPQICIFFYNADPLDFSIAILLIVTMPFLFVFTATIQQHRLEILNLNSKLEDSMLQVKKLTGLLPICATCNKIRDDKGSWSQMELYIRDHSEADFSHGICPDCLAKARKEYGLDKSK